MAPQRRRHCSIGDASHFPELDRKYSYKTQHRGQKLVRNRDNYGIASWLRFCDE